MAPSDVPAFLSLLPSLLAGKHKLVTEGGVETQLIYRRSLELRNFSAFEAALRDDWRPILLEVFKGYAELAPKCGSDCSGVTLMLDAPTWRASGDHMKIIGRSGTPEDVMEVNLATVRVIQELREIVKEEHGTTFLIAGEVGPRGDGYNVESVMTAEAAAIYHFPQVAALAKAGVASVNALTMTHTAEAVGIAKAAALANVPCVISFTIETDGRLPDGTPLLDAVEQVDAALEGSVLPAFFMVNCAHQDHAGPVLAELAIKAACNKRLLGFRANASSKSHAELDQSTELDDGDPLAFGAEMASLAKRAGLSVLGGCCGTDTRHLKQLMAHLLLAGKEEEEVAKGTLKTVHSMGLQLI